ncbi:hypothetical protein FNJ88_11055 [Chryseobacterium sp. SNU WT5]|uniref:NUMOD4 motif-containing HNH endonuclease n=1 Tax=Chryseobacterium sp. SNU WT5 TaxID=2594269 RepID=UPI00117C99B0|nr:NUMOD4 motif-containing HNH endonuclease [Chryseobacterium sp. SNU WT5]QDP86057.1 hypothetical protein FNJ88_11055 [Chryseobacterium sp. SNU WT5]
MKTTANVANIPFWQNTNLKSLPNEIWKDINGFDGYLASNLGRLKALSKPKWNGNVYYNTPEKIMKQSVAKTGYLVVSMKRKTQYVHRIIGIAFHSEENFKLLDINHINGIKTDNRGENLEWCTRSENILHAFSTGLNTSVCVVSEETAKNIIAKHHETGLGKVLLQRYFFPNVNKSTIQSITDGKNWKHLPRPLKK